MPGKEEPQLQIKKQQHHDGMDLDDLLPQVGEFGKYQKLLVWLVCLPACVPCGFCAFNQLFMADTPDHWCLVPELMEYDADVRRQLAIPATDNGDNHTTYNKCLRYDVNWTQLLSEFDIDSLTPNNSWPVVSCDRGWEFDTSEISSSIVIDYSLVCQYDIYPTYGLVALNAGGPIGVYMFGIINDRFGRRLSFFICLTTLIFGNLMSAFMPDFWLWAFCRAVVGLTIPAVYQIPFIISLELVGPNYRSFVTVMTCLFYTLGLVLLAGVTYLVRDWVHLCIVTSLPFLLYYVYWWFLPESPRWLLAKGRLEEALKILETLAAVNQKELPDSFKLKLKQRMMLQRTRSEMKRLETGPGVSALFKTPNMRLKTILITLNWFANEMVYVGLSYYGPALGSDQYLSFLLSSLVEIASYLACCDVCLCRRFANEMVYVGLSYYGPALGSDQYLSFLLSSLVEIPSYLACWVVMDRWGRRWPLVICMIASGICCIITVLLPPEAVTETLVLFLMSKFAISASFLIIYPFTGELYPTQLRGVGIGFSAYISGLGLIIIPFITYLGSEHLVLPLVIMGGVSVVGGVASLRLPETLHYRLPQTVEEGEEFGKDWTLTECFRCIPLQPNSINTSYEDLDAPVQVELQPQTYRPSLSLDVSTPDKESALLGRRVPRLVRQASIMETPLDASGSMKMTYWF